jgi:hypothetical protein
MAVARPHWVVFSCCCGEMTAVALERATRSKPSTRSEATMCWGKLPRHPGRAHAWPLCGPWPRPHLAAAKLVSTSSRCHTNRSTAPSRRSPTQGCATFAALTSLHPGLSWGRRVAAAAARAKGQETPTPAVLGSHPSEAGRCDRHWLRSQGSLSQWHEENSAWGSSPSRLGVLGRSLSHASLSLRDFGVPGKAWLVFSTERS